MIKRLKKKALVGMLMFTGLLSRADIRLPTKWYSVLESLAVSTGTLHSGLCTVDREALKEYRELETQLEHRLGLSTYYSPEDIQEIKEQVEKEASSI